MDDATAEKLARNDAAFREANDGIELAAAEHGFEGGLVPFLCECSDPSCVEIIRIPLDEYRELRKNPRRFAHARGHETEVDGAVKPIARRDGYVVVEKIGRAGDVAAELAARRETE